jgi:SAM-dependent methyltransferase
VSQLPAETCSIGAPLLLAIRDGKLQEYMQTHPFLDGPDERLNRACLTALRSNLRPRRLSGTAAYAKPLETERLLPSKEVLSRVDELLHAVDAAPGFRQHLVGDYGWKIQFVPEHSKKILAVGHHTGHELLFLRAAAPQAEIYAIDWVDRTDPRILDLVGAKVFDGSLLHELQNFKEEFDLIFSNHVLEHMYDPDLAIKILAACLTPGGRFLCGLPLDGSPGDVFEEDWRRWARDANLRRVDMGHIDPGHPWKTSVTDIMATFGQAGMRDVQVFCRPNHLTREIALSIESLRRYRKHGRMLNKLLFGPLRTLIHITFRDSPPPFLLKCLFALERRTWFGSNRFKNAQSLEVVAFCTKP